MNRIKTNFLNFKNKFLSFPRWKQVGISLVGVTSVVITFLLFLYLMVSFGMLGKIPSSKELKKLDNPLASELYDRNGVLLGKYYVENRSPITLENLNKFYQEALLATEDIRFYDHSGVDLKSLFRVFFKSLLLQSDRSGGGSTITQQLVKNMYPRKNYKILGLLLNKFREMTIARRIEDIYTKEEILLLYSNTVSFGERAFGLHTAAYRFFNKQPEDLLLEEAATLVGMLKATSYYSPRNFPDRAKDRRNTVLGQMKKYEFIDERTYDQLRQLPLKLNYQAPSAVIEKARYFKEEVRKAFNDWTLSYSKADGSKYDLFRDGLKITSTIDLGLQNQAEKQVNRHMKSLQRIFLQSWDGGKMYGSKNKVIDDKILADPYYQRLRANGLSAQKALDQFTTRAKRKVWSWKGTDERSMTKIDSIKHYLSLLHTGLLASNPSTGEILAYVGGNDFNQFQFDNIRGRRQVGSTFKPIVYLAALEGGITPCNYYKNELKTYSEYDEWTPRNADDQYGGKVSLRGALTNSMNTISVQVLFDIGIPAVVKMAERLGISSSLNQVPSLVLGTSDISLYEMVGVYSTFANRGKRTSLHTILKIEDKAGNIIYEKERTNGEQVVDQEVVDDLNEMLLNVNVNGSGRRLYQQYRIPYPIGGKTGTTQNQSDGWYIGYHEDLAIGAWVGTEDRRIHFRNLGTGSGGATALPMVGALYEYAAAHGYLKKKTRDFDPNESCDDFIPDFDIVVDQVRDIESEIERIKQEVMGKYYQAERQRSDKTNRRKRDKERDKRYRIYKRAVKDLEIKLEELKNELKEMDS